MNFIFIYTQILPFVALLVAGVALLSHFLRLIKLGKPIDYSKKTGNLPKAILYANTTAMMPTQKESAYLHLPTYSLGILFHLGAFLSILLFFVFALLNFEWASDLFAMIPLWILWLISLFLLITGLAGFYLFVHRFFSKKLKPISNLDDYLSNGLVTLFQLLTAAQLLFISFIEPSVITFVTVLYATATIVLLLYLPLGKLRHLVYYFAARYHLGYFYGWRNAWPPKSKTK